MGVGEGVGVEELDYWNWSQVDNDDENIWVVAFYVKTCRYCKKFEDVFASGAAGSQGEEGVKFGAVDVGRQRYLAWINGVRAVPTVKCFNNGESLTESGYMDSDELAEFIFDKCANL